MNAVEVVDMGDEIIPITLESQVGTLNFRDLIDSKWGMLITFDKAFEPVATTELGMVAKLLSEFEARNIAVATIGTDTIVNYRKWIKDIEELQSTKINFPLLCDMDMKVLKKLGCARDMPPVSQTTVTSYAVFLIDTDKRIRSIFKYSNTTGRNFYEILRTYDALIMTSYHRVVTPANWAQGQEVLLNPEITPEEAQNYRFAQIKPYFKLSPCPPP